jgi:hypothetical protein
MAIANGAQHSMAYVAETTYGTTPATPSFKPLPHTGTSLAITKDAIESEKLRGDRQVEDFRHGNKSVSGDVNAELEYGAFDDILEAVLCGSWASDVLKAGVTRRSFTVERKFGDLDTPEWHRHTGCEFNTLALSVSPNSMVTATFGIIGKDLSIGTSALSGATYASDSGNKPFDSFTGSIQEGGSAIATVTAIELNLANGIEPLFAVGSQTTQRPSIGKSRLTGTLTTYFESSALYEKFLNETESSMQLVLTDLDGNSYTVDIPRVKYNTGQPDVSGEGAVTIPMEFVALFDDTDASQITITRATA